MRLLPLAWTPAGVVLGESGQTVRVASGGIVDWIDRTFPPEDERSFIAAVHDVELLQRVEWHAQAPTSLDEHNVINIDDIPQDVADALAHQPAPIVQCAACRRLCVRDDFVWKERQLCAWDYHAQAFGKRGPWRSGTYEQRHFETLAACAYVAPQLLAQSGTETIVALEGVGEQVARDVVNAVIEANPNRAHLAVRTARGGVVLLAESPPA